MRQEAAHLRNEAGEDLLPVVWSDNYLSLLPGEERELEVALLTPQDETRAVLVEARGLNIERVVVPAYAAESSEKTRSPAPMHAHAH